MTSPYRPPPQAPSVDPELAELVASGQRAQQIAEQQAQQAKASASREAQSDADRQLRLSLGAYRGSPWRRWLFGVGPLLIVAGVLAETLFDAPVLVLVYSCALGFSVLLYAALMQPRVTRRTAQAEIERVRRLPYEVHGFVETLSANEVRAVRIELHFDASRPPPHPSLVTAAFCAVDGRAQLEEVQDHSIVIGTGDIPRYDRQFASGSGAYKRHQYDYRNVGPRVMQLVERVLPPLHSGLGLAQVILSPRSKSPTTR